MFHTVLEGCRKDLYYKCNKTAHAYSAEPPLSPCNTLKTSYILKYKEA